jgi:hypothetical protein
MTAWYADEQLFACCTHCVPEDDCDNDHRGPCPAGCNEPREES